MTDKVTEQAIEMMVTRLVDRFDPDQIILFGSQALRHGRTGQRRGSVGRHAVQRFETRQATGDARGAA